jgi:hypothetical protein
MSKRQGGRPKQANDFYPTPYKAVLPLIPFLRPGLRFFEPCAGAGDLISHLAAHRIHCIGACDIEPRADFIVRLNCLDLHWVKAEAFVTNPPHTHEWLAPIIEKLRVMRPTWLLLPLDWFATQQAAPFLAYCTDIVVIGRMKMDIPGSYTDGFDNFAWARFQKEPAGQTQFHGKR